MFRCLFILLIPFTVFAQQGRYTSVGATGSNLFVRDEGMSPLLYSGPGAGLNFSSGNKSPEKISFVNLSLGYNNLGNKQKQKKELHSGKFHLQYHSHWRLNPKNENTAVYLGGGIGFLSNYRFRPEFLNSAHNYDIIKYLGLSGLILKPVSILEKRLSFSYSFHIPLVAGIIRPAYASPLPEGLETFQTEYTEAYFKSLSIVSFKKFRKFNNVFSLLIPTAGRVSFKFQYEWGYYYIISYNPVLLSEHTLLFSIVILSK